jgi:hypothetical protein
MLHQRLKHASQSWTVKVAQDIVNLSAFKKSNRWNKIVDFIKNAA